MNTKQRTKKKPTTKRATRTLRKLGKPKLANAVAKALGSPARGTRVRGAQDMDAHLKAIHTYLRNANSDISSIMKNVGKVQKDAGDVVEDGVRAVMYACSSIHNLLNTSEYIIDVATAPGDQADAAIQTEVKDLKKYAAKLVKRLNQV